MKRKNNKLKYIIIVIVSFALLLGISSYTIDDDKDLNFFEKAIKDTTTFIQKIFYAPIKFVSNELEVFNEKKDLYKKIRRMDLVHSPSLLLFSKFYFFVSQYILKNFFYFFC